MSSLRPHYIDRHIIRYLLATGLHMGQTSNPNYNVFKGLRHMNVHRSLKTIKKSQCCPEFLLRLFYILVVQGADSKSAVFLGFCDEFRGQLHR